MIGKGPILEIRRRPRDGGVGREKGNHQSSGVYASALRSSVSTVHCKCGLVRTRKGVQRLTGRYNDKDIS